MEKTQEAMLELMELEVAAIDMGTTMATKLQTYADVAASGVQLGERDIRAVEALRDLVKQSIVELKAYSAARESLYLVLSLNDMLPADLADMSKSVAEAVKPYLELDLDSL